MRWPDDILALTGWALRHQDLRHQYIYSGKASDLKTTPGIAAALEVTVILAIYEAALGKGYIEGKTAGYEKPYPAVRKPKQMKKANPKRADLAFKDPGTGKNWGYVEVKKYGGNGKFWVQHDIDKLKSIEQKSQRWMIVYRVRPQEGKSQKLKAMLLKNFAGQLDIHGAEDFETVEQFYGEPGLCEYCLARVR